MINKMKTFIILLLFSCITSASASKFYNDEEITRAKDLATGTVKVENFFQENSQTMWMSIKNQDYQYTSQKQGSVNHEQAVIVKMQKVNDFFGCDVWGWLALFPNDEDSISKIYKDSVQPEFNDFFGTPFNCYIKFFGSTEHKFLVLDYIETSDGQKGKGFPQFATDAFIKFAKTHTSAENILCDPRNHIYKHIAEKFGFILDRENALWAYFKKGVNEPYLLSLSK